MGCGGYRGNAVQRYRNLTVLPTLFRRSTRPRTCAALMRTGCGRVSRSEGGRALPLLGGFRRRGFNDRYHYFGVDEERVLLRLRKTRQTGPGSSASSSSLSAVRFDKGHPDPHMEFIRRQLMHGDAWGEDRHYLSTTTPGGWNVGKARSYEGSPPVTTWRTRTGSGGITTDGLSTSTRIGTTISPLSYWRQKRGSRE